MERVDSMERPNFLIKTERYINNGLRVCEKEDNPPHKHKTTDQQIIEFK